MRTQISPGITSNMESFQPETCLAFGHAWWSWCRCVITSTLGSVHRCRSMRSLNEFDSCLYWVRLIGSLAVASRGWLFIDRWEWIQTIEGTHSHPLVLLMLHCCKTFKTFQDTWGIPKYSPSLNATIPKTIQDQLVSRLTTYSYREVVVPILPFLGRHKRQVYFWL